MRETQELIVIFYTRLDKGHCGDLVNFKLSSLFLWAYFLNRLQARCCRMDSLIVCVKNKSECKMINRNKLPWKEWGGTKLRSRSQFVMLTEWRVSSEASFLIQSYTALVLNSSNLISRPDHHWTLAALGSMWLCWRQFLQLRSWRWYQLKATCCSHWIQPDNK